MYVRLRRQLVQSSQSADEQCGAGVNGDDAAEANGDDAAKANIEPGVGSLSSFVIPTICVAVSLPHLLRCACAEEDT